MEDCIKLKSVSFLIVFFCFFLQEVFSECDNWMTVSIDRTVRKQGFHREIVSNVSWSIENYDTKLKCSLLLIYHIPRGMFVDLDEIRSQNASKIVPIGDPSTFDVERPSHLSTEQNILIYSNLKKQDTQTRALLQLTSSIVLPVHWRYQPPTDDQYYVPVPLPTYTVLGRCEDLSVPGYNLQQCLNKLDHVKYSCNYDTAEICDWFVMKHSLNVRRNSAHIIKNKDNKTLFHVPVGVKKHTYLVACGTIFVSLLASYILIQLPPLNVDKAKVT